MRNLSPDVLLDLGYSRESWKDEDEEEVVNWSKDGLTLFEDQWSNPKDYLFAGRTREDGSFKSGWIIKTDEQLISLQNSLSGKI